MARRRNPSNKYIHRVALSQLDGHNLNFSAPAMPSLESITVADFGYNCLEKIKKKLFPLLVSNNSGELRA